MKLIILAFILSLCLHLLLFTTYKAPKIEDFNKALSSKNIDKHSVRLVKLLPRIEKKPIIKRQEKPKAKKLENYKRVDKKKIIPQKKVRTVKNAKRTIAKPIQKVEVKPTPTKQIPKKVQIRPQEKRKTIPKKSLENFFLTEPGPLDRNMLDDITKSYLSLYGEEYNSFTKVQKVYLQKNLKNIGRITQKYLKYPRIAVRTGQQGMNIVQFYLHPNGDISDLKLVASSDYKVLDKNSIETIEIAYKDYPKPKTKTKIKIYVYYKLY